MKTEALTLIRTIAFAIAGFICAAYAVAASAGVSGLTHWLPITGGITAAAIIFVSGAFAGPCTMAAFLDEGDQTDTRTAPVVGLWAAMVTGTGLWILDFGGDLKLANILSAHRTVPELNQAQLAEAVGVSRKTVNTVGNRGFVPSTLLALRITTALGASVHDLYHIEKGRE